MAIIRALIPVILLLRLSSPSTAAAAGEEDSFSFTFHGFAGANLALTQLATVTPEGLLRLTNDTQQMTGHAFYRSPLRLKNPSHGNKSLSFSTSFVFAIKPRYPDVFGHGIVFVISPTVDLAGAVASQHLGLPGDMANSSHVVGVEFDIVRNEEFGDRDNNHVGIDINSLRSVKSATASYADGGELKTLRLSSGNPVRAWVDYNGPAKCLEVTISPAEHRKPATPLLSYTADLSSIVMEKAYVGFSASTGAASADQYVLGWSFRLEGKADEMEMSKLPSLPHVGSSPGKIISKGFIFGGSAALVLLVLLAAAVALVICAARRRRKFEEVLEDWEEEYGPHRFCYRDLYKATRGFDDDQIVGVGGFGKVYRGLLRSSPSEVAVKKVSHSSQQGMREFVSEIVCMGRLRHRNLVRLLGYCRRREELLLVYEYMPNGSLDKFLFEPGKPGLKWGQRFSIVKGVASGLLYLHSGWEKVVVHRDIKASNVLLDVGMNARLSDFGLARLYDHGGNPHTTHIVGTLGYMAPELCKTGKATTATDVYAFGVFMLEVACGRRPMETNSPSDETFLVDWVRQWWKRGSIREAADSAVLLWDGGKVDSLAEMELVLVLGLLCAHPEAEARPSMQQVLQHLERDAPLPEPSSLDGLESSSVSLRRQSERQSGGCDDFVMTVQYPATSDTTFREGSPLPSDPFFSSRR